MLMALGIVSALFERERSGHGQVVDAAMVDGASLFTAFMRGMHAVGLWQEEAGTNILDGAAPFYDTFACADGRHVAVGCVEPHFFQEMLALLEIDDPDLPFQLDLNGWPELKKVVGEKFLEKTRDEWAEIFADSDACVTPVLSPWEAHEHPHHVARGSFVEVDGIIQPAPAPRFGWTPAAPPVPMDAGGRDVVRTLEAWAIDEAETAGLLESGALA
jgi:alpha-methylacyl-CoA racemase